MCKDPEILITANSKSIQRKEEQMYRKYVWKELFPKKRTRNLKILFAVAVLQKKKEKKNKEPPPFFSQICFIECLAIYSKENKKKKNRNRNHKRKLLIPANGPA